MGILPRNGEFSSPTGRTAVLPEPFRPRQTGPAVGLRSVEESFIGCAGDTTGFSAACRGPSGGCPARCLPTAALLCALLPHGSRHHLSRACAVNQEDSAGPRSVKLTSWETSWHSPLELQKETRANFLIRNGSCSGVCNCERALGGYAGSGLHISLLPPPLVTKRCMFM